MHKPSTPTLLTTRRQAFLTTNNTVSPTPIPTPVPATLNQNNMAQQVTTHILTPMLTPGSPNAPYFKGERVNNFLDSLEVHADSAQIAHNDLPAYVLRYCH